MNNGILVVDDDDAHRGMLRTMLRSWGYTVDEAADGDEAVALVREKAFDVVLTDVRMARMDGIHALKGILEYNPALPVVLMTAYSSVETAVEALRLGAYDYLVKPLDFEALKHTLEQAIEHSRLSVENRELAASSPTPRPVRIFWAAARLSRTCCRSSARWPPLKPPC